MSDATRSGLALLVFIGAVAAAPTPSPSPPSPSPRAATPCGEVLLRPAARPVVDKGTYFEKIRVTVKFADGHTESDLFPYPFVYPDGERTDPWSESNMQKSFDTPVQLPPAGTDRTLFSPLIRYVLDHTTGSGYTNLRDCPKGTPR